MVDSVSHNPISLYRCCVDYIAWQLDLVESLVGLPELLGREIFRAARDGGNRELLCWETVSTRRCIQVFFDAYGDGDILTSLSLEKAHVFLNDIIDDCWFVFQHLSRLDLSSCGIGDNHDVLSLLEGMLRLETLVLRDNLLTNEGIRKLTVRPRMYGESFSSLKFLDISDNNGITVRSVSFLRCLPHLALLNMSHTSLTFKDTVFLDDWQVCTEQDVCDCVTSCFLVRTEGWAADFLNSWKLQVDVPGTKSCKFAESSPVARFYSRGKSRTVTKSSNTQPAGESQNKTSALILKSHQFSCDHCQPHISFPPHCDSRHKAFGTSHSQKVFSHNVTTQRVFTNSFSDKQVKLHESRTGVFTNSCSDKQVKLHDSRTGVFTNSCSEKRVKLHESRTGVFTNGCSEKQVKLHESRTRCTFPEDDYETSLISQYKCSPPKKKTNKGSLLQQLENFS